MSIIEWERGHWEEAGPQKYETCRYFKLNAKKVRIVMWKGLYQGGTFCFTSAGHFFLPQREKANFSFISDLGIR